MIQNESILDPESPTLDNAVFVNAKHEHPVIVPRIKEQILNNVRKINKISKVIDYFVVGSILTKRYLPNSDIDVTVQVKKLSEDGANKRNKLLKVINGLTAKGTLHPINYFVIDEEYDDQNADNIYDLSSDTWIKTSSPSQATVKDVIGEFEKYVQQVDLKKDRLERDIIDVKILKILMGMNPREKRVLKRQMQVKVAEVQKNMKQIVDFFSTIKKRRENAFREPLSMSELAELGSKNNLSENILYKLFERYEYLNLYHHLKNSIDERQLKIQKTLDLL